MQKWPPSDNNYKERKKVSTGRQNNLKEMKDHKMTQKKGHSEHNQKAKQNKHKEETKWQHIKKKTYKAKQNDHKERSTTFSSSFDLHQSDEPPLMLRPLC